MSNKRNSIIDPDQPMIYQIRIKGHLGPHWAHIFDGLSIMLEDNGDTLLTGPVVDQHCHGLPTSPRVNKYLGNGDYLIDGMKFQMGGLWLMDLTITADTQIDAVHFNMLLH